MARFLPLDFRVVNNYSGRRLNPSIDTTASAESAARRSWLQRVLIGRNPRRTLIRASIWAVVCLIIFKFILLPIRVEGVSMMPTYKENGVNLLNRLAYAFHPPRRGDIVGIKLAGKSIMYCKRIVALPGESISFHDGQIYIDGRLLEEPYLKRPCRWEHGPIQVGPDEYYVVGDNRSMDFYDHEQGRAERQRILGRVVF